MCLERTVRFKGTAGFQLLEQIENESRLKEISQNETIIRILREHYQKINSQTADTLKSQFCTMPNCLEEAVGKGYFRLKNEGWRNLCLKHYFDALDLHDRKHTLTWKSLEWTFSDKKLCHFAYGNKYYRGCERLATDKVLRLTTKEILPVCAKCAQSLGELPEKWRVLGEPLRVGSEKNGLEIK